MHTKKGTPPHTCRHTSTLTYTHNDSSFSLRLIVHIIPVVTIIDIIITVVFTIVILKSLFLL